MFFFSFTPATSLLSVDEHKYWYFEIIIILHKCIMTGAMVIVESGTPQQPFIAMLIQAMFLLLVLKVAPYNDDLDDWSSFVCSLALTFTTFAGFLLMIEANSTQQPVLSVGVLTTFLIASNAACFAYEIVVIMYVAYQDTLAKKATKLLKLKNNNNKNTKEMSTSSTTKVMPAKSNADNAKIKIKQKHEAENQEFEDWGADGDEAMWT